LLAALQTAKANILHMRCKQKPDGMMDTASPM